MGCCTSQQYAGRPGTPSGSDTKGNRPLAQMPAVKFISTDCKAIVNIASRRVTLDQVNVKELTRSCATITKADSIYILSGGLEGDAAFWEISNGTPLQHPTPDVAVIGGTFVASARHLYLVGAKVRGKTQGSHRPGPLVAFDTKRKRWRNLVDASTLVATQKASVHPCLLEGAGVCLSKNGSEDETLIFVGGVYELNGKSVPNEKFSWLEVKTGGYGDYEAARLTTPLKNPHIVNLEGTREVIVAGGTSLTTNKKIQEGLQSRHSRGQPNHSRASYTPTPSRYIQHSSR